MILPEEREHDHRWRENRTPEDMGTIGHRARPFRELVVPRIIVQITTSARAELRSMHLGSGTIYAMTIHRAKVTISFRFASWADGKWPQAASRAQQEPDHSDQASEPCGANSGCRVGDGIDGLPRSIRSSLQLDRPLAFIRSQDPQSFFNTVRLPTQEEGDTGRLSTWRYVLVYLYRQTSSLIKSIFWLPLKFMFAYRD